MTTIYDIAKLAKVSPATVSRVLNKKKNVSPATRKKIETICEKLNYIPNSNAVSLKKKKTKTLALVIPDIPNPFFISILQGFEQLAIKNGFNTIICNTNQNYEKEKNYLKMILEKRIDGVAISTVSEDSTHVKKIINKNIPFILIDRKIKGLDVDIVCGDSYQGAINLVNHLIENGHSKIAMIAAPIHLSTSRERVDGYKVALQKANLSFNPKLLKVQPTNNIGYSKKEAYLMTKELIKSKESFDAIFVANNLMALGTYKALLEENYKVPQDIALVCFDDLSLDYEIEPFFTVMKQPAHTMGKVAAKILLNKINGEYEGNKQKVVFQAELIVRKSSVNNFVD